MIPDTKLMVPYGQSHLMQLECYRKYANPTVTVAFTLKLLCDKSARAHSNQKQQCKETKKQKQEYLKGPIMTMTVFVFELLL